MYDTVVSRYGKQNCRICSRLCEQFISFALDDDNNLVTKCRSFMNMRLITIFIFYDCVICSFRSTNS